MPHEDLLNCVSECINEQGHETVSTDKCGVSTGAFLEILSTYLKSTLVGWKEGVYVQKSGICIGSKVAPVLSDLYLSKTDKLLEGTLGNSVKVLVMGMIISFFLVVRTLKPW